VPLSDQEKFLLDIPEDNRLRQSLYRAARKNPDQSAKIVQLSDSQQLPMDTVERNIPEVDARHHYGKLDAAEIKKNSPTTAKYLEDEKNAAVSIDDVDNLQALEQNLQPEHGFWSNTGRGGIARSSELIGNLIEFGGTMAEGHRATDRVDPGITIGEDGISWHWDLPSDSPSVLSSVGEFISEGAAGRTQYTPRFTWENLKGDVTPTNLAGYIIEQGVKSLPDMAATIATLPAYIASRTEEIAETRAQNDQRDVDSDDLKRSIVTATVVSLLERVGAKGVFDMGLAETAKDVGIAAGEAFVKEGVTEFVQEGIEYYGETVGTKVKVDHADALDRAFAGLVAGAPMGGGIRGTTATVQAVASRMEKNATRTARSMNEQLQLEEFISLAQSSKTRERAQDRFKAFLSAAGNDKAIHVPGAEINNLIEQGVELPQYLLDQEIDPDMDVEIPVDVFGSEIAPNEELMNQLRPHIRLGGDTLSSAELLEGTDTSIKALMDKADKLTDLKTETDAIYENVKDQIVHTGRQGEQTAKWSAMLIPAFVTVKAEELGISPTEVYEKMGFTVVGPSKIPAPPDSQTLSQETPDLVTPQKYMLNDAPEILTEDIDLEASGLDEFISDKENEGGIRKIKLLETRGRNQHGNPVGTVLIIPEDGTTMKAEVTFNESPILSQEEVTEEITDEDGSVYEVTIKKRHLDKKIAVIEKLKECIAA